MFGKVTDGALQGTRVGPRWRVHRSEAQPLVSCSPGSGLPYFPFQALPQSHWMSASLPAYIVNSSQRWMMTKIQNQFPHSSVGLSPWAVNDQAPPKAGCLLHLKCCLLLPFFVHVLCLLKGQILCFCLWYRWLFRSGGFLRKWNTAAAAVTRCSCLSPPCFRDSAFSENFIGKYLIFTLGRFNSLQDHLFTRKANLELAMGSEDTEVFSFFNLPGGNWLSP